VAQTERLIAEGYDLFFNLCDGAADQDIPGIEVIEALERHGVPFTGAVSECYEPTRTQMKEACHQLGIATPAYIVAKNDADVERAAQTLSFPLFVKHHNSYASVDLSRRSRVQSPAGLRQQARKIMSRHGAALIEEYIEGIECTVLVAENPEDPQRPITYAPVQYRFPEGEDFKHARLKWVEYDGLTSFAVADTELAARLRDECGRFFVQLKAASFGRCDLRVDRAGTPHMLAHRKFNVRSEARCLHQPFDIALARRPQSAIGRSSSWAFLSIQRSTCSPVHPRSRFAPPADFITHPTMSLPRQAELLPAPTPAHGTATSSRQVPSRWIVDHGLPRVIGERHRNADM
jgi:D-alanine-D-alanine ligase-like ATP-grasp enzyme